MSKVEIQLLSDQLPTEHPEILAEIDLLREGLFKDIGWHYYVDLVWVISQLHKMGLKPGSTLLDAGAGNGLLQFLLSFIGYHVLSLDFAPRRFPFYIKRLFPIEVLTPAAPSQERYVEHLAFARGNFGIIRKIGPYFFKRKFHLSSWFRLKEILASRKNKPGTITVIQNDMRQMSQVDDQSVDAVVSVSAVEHLQPDQLTSVFTEFARVMKPEAPMILTTNASGTEEDWFHEPSQGWCFSQGSMAAWFGRASIFERRFSNFDNFLADYQKNDFLRQRLATFHFYSDKSGMPNGIWNPLYIPVGVVALRGDLPDRRDEKDVKHA